MNRAGRSTGTARRPFDAWNPVEREMNSRQSCNVSLTRLAIRAVLWSFIFIPHVLPCRFLIARKQSGLVGRSTAVPAVDRSEVAYSPTRSGSLFRRRFAGRFLCLLPDLPGRRIVDCRANAYAKSGPSRAKSRRGKGSGDPRAPSPNVRLPKCFNFDICGSRACGRHETPSSRCTRIQKIFSGFSRTRRVARASRVRRHGQPAKIVECFRPETRMPAATFSHTRNNRFRPNR